KSSAKAEPKLASFVASVLGLFAHYGPDRLSRCPRTRRGAEARPVIKCSRSRREDRPMPETRPANMSDRIAAMQDFKLYRELHWEGSFDDYLAIVREKPQVTRNAYQRLYDMIISYGTEEYIDNKKKLIRYNFFKD